MDRRLEEGLQLFPGTPPTFFFDVAGQAVQTAIETQKSAIDLVVEQTKAVAEHRQAARRCLLQDRRHRDQHAFQTTVERSVEAQKKVLEFAAEQNKADVRSHQEAARQRAGGTVVVDTFERGAEYADRGAEVDSERHYPAVRHRTKRLSSSG